MSIIRGLHGKISAQALYKRPPWQDLCTRSPWLSKWAPLSTVPQRERSDPHKLTRGLREWSQNEHRATTKAIRHAQSDERVAPAHGRFSQNIARTTKNERSWTCQKWCFTLVSATFWPRSTKYCACHKKWSWGIRSAAPATQNPHHARYQNDGWFRKRDFRSFQNVVQVHQTIYNCCACHTKKTSETTFSFWPTPANVLVCFSNMQKVPRLPHEMDTAQKTSAARVGKTTRMRTPRMNSSPFIHLYRKNPKSGHTVWEIHSIHMYI